MVVGSRSRSQLRPLEALSALVARPLTAAELSRVLGTNRSTALRLVRELVGAGWVLQDESKRYVAGGPMLWQLTRSVPDEPLVRAVVEPMLVTVRDEFSEAAAFAVPVADSMVYTSFVPSRQEIGLQERIGTSRPMYCSALGKAYLAALPTSLAEAEVRRFSYSGGTARAPQNADELRIQIDATRSAGYALDLGETLVSAHCVAVPVAFSGTVWGSAGVQGPADRLPEDRLRQIGEHLVALAACQSTGSTEAAALVGRSRPDARRLSGTD